MDGTQIENKRCLYCGLTHFQTREELVCKRIYERSNVRFNIGDIVSAKEYHYPDQTVIVKITGRILNKFVLWDDSRANSELSVDYPIIGYEIFDWRTDKKRVIPDCDYSEIEILRTNSELIEINERLCELKEELEKKYGLTGTSNFNYDGTIKLNLVGKLTNIDRKK